MWGSDYYAPKVGEDYRETMAQMIREEDERRRIVRTQKAVPMPFVKRIPGTNDVVYITEEWYTEAKQRAIANRAIDRKEWQLDIMQLLLKEDRLKGKLNELNPKKKKDSKKIININKKLKDIQVELRYLQQQSGIMIDEVRKGSRLGRFIGRIKSSAKKITKKVRKTYKRNKDMLANVLSVAIPVVVVGLIKKALAFLVI